MRHTKFYDSETLKLVDEMNPEYMEKLDDFISDTVVRVYSTDFSKNEQVLFAVEKLLLKDTQNVLTQDSMS